MDGSQRGGNVDSRRQFGPFVIDVSERLLLRDGQPVPLTPKAFDVLAALIERPGRLISKEELLQNVWPDAFVEESNLAYNVFALRKALGDGTDNGRYIETVPKHGYRFTATVTSLNDASAAAALVPRDAESDGSGEPVAASLGHGERHLPLSRRSGVVALVLVAAVVSVASRWPARPPDVASLRAVPLTALRGVARSPSLSPDGNYVVFSWTGEKQGNPDLYVQQIGAGAPLRLTTDPGNDYSPNWSPDGRTIAFLRGDAASAKSEVRLIAPLGGTERHIADIQPRLPTFRPVGLAWCPDSSCLIVTDAQTDARPDVTADVLFVVAIDTGEKRQLTFSDLTSQDVDPAVSPDGRSLAFRRNTTPFSGSFHALTLNPGVQPHGQPVALTPPLNAGKPAWTADGRDIIFSQRGSLWRLDPARRSAPARLPFVGEDGISPTLARGPDRQQRMVYVRSLADLNVWRVDVPEAGAAARTPPVTAISSTREDDIPSLSPDERQIAFVSNRSGDVEIWRARIDGSDPTQVTSMAILPGFPRWSPDGQLLAFHGDPRGRPDVLVVRAAGGKPRVLPTPGPNAGQPSFSRDGRWIYFTVADDTGSQIWKIPVAGGDAVRVANAAGSIAIESPDGRDLYYVSTIERPGALWRLSLGGGTPVKVVDGVVLGNFDVIERGIYYIDRTTAEEGDVIADPAGGGTRLRFYDFSTRKSITVRDNLGTVGYGLSAARNGRTIFFSRIDSSVDELMLVDDFR